MRLFEIVVRKHYRQEPWHDVSGYELEIVRTAEEPTWSRDEEMEYDDAKRMLKTLINALQEETHVPKTERVDDNTVRLVDWFSIGD